MTKTTRVYLPKWTPPICSRCGRELVWQHYKMCDGELERRLECPQTERHGREAEKR